MRVFDVGVDVTFGIGVDRAPVWHFDQCIIEPPGIPWKGVVVESPDPTLIRVQYNTEKDGSGQDICCEWPAPGHPQFAGDQWQRTGYLLPADAAYQELRDSYIRHRDLLILDVLELTNGELRHAPKLAGVQRVHVRGLIKGARHDSPLKRLKISFF